MSKQLLLLEVTCPNCGDELTDGSKVTIGSADDTPAPAAPAGQRQRGQRPAGATGERPPRADGSARPSATTPPAAPQ